MDPVTPGSKVLKTKAVISAAELLPVPFPSGPVGLEQAAKKNAKSISGKKGN
jgi:hypothetical protein